MSQLRDVIDLVARALADAPDRVDVKESELRDLTVIELSLAPADVGKLVGRQGRTASALRALLAVTAERYGKKATLEIRDLTSRG